MSTLQTISSLINIHRILETRLRNKGGKFLNFLEAKAKMETQEVIESVTHAARMHRQAYLTTRNVLTCFYPLCVCVSETA